MSWLIGGWTTKHIQTFASQIVAFDGVRCVGDKPRLGGNGDGKMDDCDNYQELESKREQSLIRILAQGLQTMPEDELRQAVSTSVMLAIKNMNLTASLNKLLEPIVQAEFTRLTQTDEFKSAVQANVDSAARTVLSRLRIEFRNY